MDIDIDVPPTFDAQVIFPESVPASMIQNGKLIRHPVGTYFQSMPVDPITGLAAIPYDVAPTYGYTKIDFLHLTVLQYYGSKSTIRSLIDQEPNWRLLRDPEVVSQLFHINKQFQLVDAVAPTSVQALADTLALMRPGKRHLLDRYLRNPDATRAELYKREENKYAFKKSHAIAYALTIVLQLHAIDSGNRVDEDDLLVW